jgi:hypothetical protein
MVKDIVEPMFKTMLPGPLATLHFTKIELGATPIVLSNVKVTKTAHDGIKLDLNVDWNGQCDIELDGNMMPKVVRIYMPSTQLQMLNALAHCSTGSERSCTKR